MITIKRVSAVQLDGKIEEGACFETSVPQNSFEGLFLKEFVIRTLWLVFEDYDHNKSINEKTSRNSNKRRKMFSGICDTVSYDKLGRYFLDHSKSGKYSPKNTSLFVIIKAEETKQNILEYEYHPENRGENPTEDYRHTDIDNEIDDIVEKMGIEDKKNIAYFFDVVAQDAGVLQPVGEAMEGILAITKGVTVKKK
jgi:hypothetical protein